MVIYYTCLIKAVHDIDRLSFDKLFALSQNTRTKSHGLNLRKKYTKLNVKCFFSQRVLNGIIYHIL